MHLKQLLEQYSHTAATGIPEWMIGCYKRRSISFANGMTDAKTHVFWLQGRNLTIDLRLPQITDQIQKPWQSCTQQEIHQLANYEGWFADTKWEHQILSWSGGTSFQIHNRWPEPAILNRVGDCMLEYSPNNTYVEDWRLKSRKPGPLVSLELLEETNLTTGECRHRRGALIINGDWAGLVLGRAEEIITDVENVQIRNLLKQNDYEPDLCAQVFNFETSVAQGNLDAGFKITHSTKASRLDQSLFTLEGFEFDQAKNEIIHTFDDNDEIVQRRFIIDTFESSFNYHPTTAWVAESKHWFEQEHQTLGRYLDIVD
ncbi:MAG: hypothetical protein P1U57_07385 [Oleibacter sp.]|nr:hypothetical protein [Thalassolituus sp.]